MRLWVDDERQAPEGWAWAKSYEEAIDILTAENVTEMSLDYMLGGGLNGDDVLYWLNDNPEHWPETIHTHSSLDGANRLMQAIIRRNCKR